MVGHEKEICPRRVREVIQDMYSGTKTRVKTRCGRTEFLEVKVGLHQGSALSPLLFILIMDMLAEEARTINHPGQSYSHMTWCS